MKPYLNSYEDGFRMALKDLIHHDVCYCLERSKSLTTNMQLWSGYIDGIKGGSNPKSGYLTDTSR
jgi:hypothetical protein